MQLTKKRYFILAYGVIMLLCLGLIYGWSIFVAPLEAEFGWARSETSLTFTISISCFCLGGLLASLVSKKTGPLIPLLISSGLLLFGFISASRVQSLLGIYLSYGVGCGLGVGFGYNVLLGVVNRWFPDKPGFASGVLLMGFGCGGMILGSVATALMGSIGWRSTFLAFGVLFCAVVLLGAFIIKPPAKDTIFPAPKAKTVGENREQLDLTAGQMIKRPSFWAYFLWCTILPAGGLMCIGNAAPIGMELGATAAVAALGAGLLSVFNGLGRVVFGMLYDQIGRKRTMLSIVSCFVLASLLLILAWRVPGLVMLFAAFVFLGLAYGGVPTVNAAFLQDFYGKQNFATNLSILNMSLMLGSIGGPPVASAILTATGSYSGVAFVVLGFTVIGIVSMQMIKKP